MALSGASALSHFIAPFISFPPLYDNKVIQFVLYVYLPLVLLPNINFMISLHVQITMAPEIIYNRNAKHNSEL